MLTGFVCSMDAALLRDVEGMVWEGNLSDNWQKFIQGFELLMKATGFKKKKDTTVKTAALLHCLRQRGRDVYNNFSFDDGNDMNYDVVKAKFELYFRPKKNVEFERYKFLNVMQGDLSVADFIGTVKHAVKGCEFGEMQDSLIKTKIIHGVSNDDLRKRLLSREIYLSLKLKKCVIHMKR